MNSFQQRSVLNVLLAISLSACAATMAGTEPGAPAGSPTQAKRESMLPTPSAPLDLSAAPGTNVTLEEVLRRLSKVTGVTFSPSSQVNERLKVTSIALSQDTRIAVAEIYPKVESILQQNGFSLAMLDGGATPLVGVYSNSVPNQSPPPVQIDVERIAECRVHPAFLFTTVVTLPNTDVRSLGNSLRILSPDTQSGGVIPVGTTHSVILNGNGRQVADLVAMLQQIDAKAATKSEIPQNP